MKLTREYVRSEEIKRSVPGGKQVAGAQAYCNAWRKYAEPLALASGWNIHSFGNGFIKLVSKDYQHTQTISLAFIEALDPIVRGFNEHSRTQARHLSQGSVRPVGREPDHDDALPPEAHGPET